MPITFTVSLRSSSRRTGRSAVALLYPLTVLLAALCASGAGPANWLHAAAPDNNLTLWYQAPASDWEREALPIGNGRLGGMVFGGVAEERIQFNEDSLWIGDEQDTGSYQAFGDLWVRLAGPLAGGVSNPSQHATSPRQTVAMSVDGDAQTKWCMEHGGREVVWQVVFPEDISVPLQSYTLTSADDVPSRDPCRWSLLGSHDGVQWTELDRRTLDGPFAARHRAQEFEFENQNAYRAYRFVFTPTDRSHFQVADIALGPSDSAFRAIPAAGGVSNPSQHYRRALDISTAVQTTEYQLQGTIFRRTCFSSAVAQVLVLRLEADQPHAYSGTIQLTDAHRGTITAEGDRITMAGSLDGYVYGGGSTRGRTEPYSQALQYEAQIVVLPQGGTLSARGDAGIPGL